MLTQQLKQEILQLEADFCFALSDPTRILMLYTLNESPRNVSDLAIVLGIPQPAASRHLKVLRDRGLVNTHKQGASVTYRLSDPRLIQALDLLRALVRERLAYQATLVNEIK